MWWKRSTRVLLGILVIASSAALPLIAQDAPASGAWSGVAYFGPESQQLTAPVTFDIDGTGLLSGQIRFDFQYEGMASNLIQLMSAHGCIANFQSIVPDGSPVSGYFMDATRAVGAFSISACYLESYGELTFRTPVSGVWYAEHTGESGLVFDIQPTPAAGVAAITGSPTQPPTPAAPVTEAAASAEVVAGGDDTLAFGVQVYLDLCSECHGQFGEGAPGVANLTERRIQRMSDEQLLQIINLGVEGTEMKPFGVILSEEQKPAVLQVIRNPEVLKDRYR